MKLNPCILTFKYENRKYIYKTIQCISSADLRCEIWDRVASDVLNLDVMVQGEIREKICETEVLSSQGIQ